MLAHALDNKAAQEFAADVHDGLSKVPQRELHSKYLYDDIGTALFEVITLLPEYGLTRADERLLKLHAEDIVRHVSSPAIVAELGSGSGRKSRPILEAMARRDFTAYYPIDVSPAALRACRNELGGLTWVQIHEIEGGYLDGLREVTGRRNGEQSLLVLFLGSTIGNFERRPAEVFLKQVRALLNPGDMLLLGADLIKPVAQLQAAYADPTGVTAAFNLNLLARINRELDGDFNLNCFDHEVRYNQLDRRVEMHLRSVSAQAVTIRAADLQFTLLEGETIWTESSHKFGLAEIDELAGKAGYECVEQWVDREWPFAESLLRVKSP